MRDPARIDPFLEELAAIWKQVPDWRFGQLIMNLAGRADPWDWEESDWKETFEEFEKPKELTDEDIRLRAEALLRMMNLDPGGRDSFE